MSHLGITINKKLDENFSESSYKLLKKFYMLPTETSPQEAFARAAVAYSGNDMKFAQRIYDYASKGYFMFSSPMLSNAPLPNEPKKTLPISCFLTYVPDTLNGLIDHSSEIRHITIRGGGVSGYWGDVRTTTAKSTGAITFIHTIDADMIAYKQGETRKGSYAAYLNISHPDIVEFIEMKIPSGDFNRKNFNLFCAVNITDHFMECVEDNLSFDLIHPETKEIYDTVDARSLWEKMLITRSRTGVPYLNFIDTVNEALPPTMKDAGLKIHSSNLCNEIHLPTDPETSAVCCLASLNLEHFYELISPSPEGYIVVKDIIKLLDNVITYFIEHCPKTLERSKRGAIRDRPLGLGVMGLHSYFMKHGIVFESEQASVHNDRIFKTIKQLAVEQTLEMGRCLGECESMVGTGRRNSHLLAIAPTANISMILNCSPGVEPIKSNAYTHRSRIGSHLIRNKYLKEDLYRLGLDNKDYWTQIILNNGSIQKYLPHLAKRYATANEIDQRVLVRLATDRQKYICQGQSINLFFKPNDSVKYIHDTHFQMWKDKGKGLYYFRTETSQKPEIISDIDLDCDMDRIVKFKDECEFNCCS